MTTVLELDPIKLRHGTPSPKNGSARVGRPSLPDSDEDIVHNLVSHVGESEITTAVTEKIERWIRVSHMGRDSYRNPSKSTLKASNDEPCWTFLIFQEGKREEQA